MPVYEFLCETCGPFEQRRSYQEANGPAVCPSCQATAKRVYSVPVLLGGMAARRREEQRAEPRLVTRPLDETPVQPAKGRHPRGRPWQLGH